MYSAKKNISRFTFQDFMVGGKKRRKSAQPKKSAKKKKPNVGSTGAKSSLEFMRTPAVVVVIVMDSTPPTISHPKVVPTSQSNESHALNV